MSMTIENQKPNVLILYSDQHSARTLGCYGNKEIYTPNLDQLANDGVLFERAYTQNPICTPSRMSFLSGQYVHNFNYFGLMGPCPDKLPNMFSVFKEHGYRTGLSGKTHTPSGWLSPDVNDLADGFGYETRINPHMYHLLEGVQGIKYNDYNLYLQEKGLLEKRDDKIYREWFDKHNHNAGQGLDAKPSELPKDETIEAWSAMRAKSFIKASAQDNVPFFYWMTVPRPHQTYVPAQEFWNMYDENELSLPPNSNNPMHLRHPNTCKQKNYFKNSKEWISFEPRNYESARKRVLRGYYANVTQVDDAIGQVLSELDASGVRENTIVLYLTDHGEFAGEHGMIEKAPGIGFHCVTRIPTIVSWKGKLPANVRRNALIESVDWFPTLCALCNIKIPEYVDGIDICKTISNDEKLRQYSFTENAYTKTVHSQRYKLTQYLSETNHGEDFGELYDLENDPYEMDNLYFEESYQEVVNELRYEILKWLVRTSRHKTLNPSILTSSGLDGDWDLGKEFVAEDGKLKNSFVKNMIDSEKFNYF